ncbi:hypothetical protein ACTFIZ_009940 [Dictyostelium cf. discoideum]
MSTNNLLIEFFKSNINFFIGAGILALNAYAFYNNNNLKLDSCLSDQKIKIKKIIIYPIKSCKGVEVKSCKWDKYGFVNDRRFMLIENGRFMSQRKTPKMALIQPNISEDGKWLIIKDKDNTTNELRVLINDANRKEVINVGIWKDNVNVVDCGEEASVWLSNYLGIDGVRLVAMASGGSYTRRVDTSYIDKQQQQQQQQQQEEIHQVSLCDGSQTNILSESSIYELNNRIYETRKSNGEEQRSPLTWERFRPNILVSTGDKPFEEDTWEQINISGLVLKKLSAGCPRCKLTTVDFNSGVLNPYDDNEPLRTLETFRKFDSGLLFGAEFIHEFENEANGTEISVGDIINVLKV